MLTSLRKLATLRVALALLLFVAMRAVMPPMTMPADSASGFVVVMCSTSGMQAAAPAPELPKPLSHSACDDHCRLVASTTLALIAVLFFVALVNAARTNTSILPRRLFRAPPTLRSQTARAPPIRS